MLDIRNIQVYGFDHAIRGMRNPLKSWGKSDSEFEYWECIEGETSADIYNMKDIGGQNSPEYYPDSNYVPTYYPQVIQLGDSDLNLMQRLTRAGSDHRKFMRQLTVYCDINAPLYWWKEFDTYKVGTTANSESTMHKLMSSELTLEDFSVDGTSDENNKYIQTVIKYINTNIKKYKNLSDTAKTIHDGRYLKEITKKKNTIFRAVIQILPSSFMQSRTISMNYEVLLNIYRGRKTHKLSEWRVDFVEQLVKKVPYADKLIIEV